MNREQLFESVMKEFQNKAIDIFEEVASKTVIEYLPHIETDTEFNAQSFGQQLVEDFVAGRRTWRTELIVKGVSAQAVRAAIFQQYRPELEQGLIADLTDKVAELEESLRRAYERY